jgi:hypothetical protein
MNVGWQYYSVVVQLEPEDRARLVGVATTCEDAHRRAWDLAGSLPVDCLWVECPEGVREPLRASQAEAA